MSQPKQTRHAATDPQKCRDMEKRYGWKLTAIEATGNPILKVNCVFSGKAEFPKARIDYGVDDT
ncbi:MAG: hypothetical protein F6K04_15990 [Leptolyngbya sp. SIO4C5]|nr:hypothetical protein [Leptolyngbya sp. SIO4C5]